MPPRPTSRSSSSSYARTPSARGIAVGARLREARAATGLSQHALARTVGISQPSLSHAESGIIVPELDTLEALARALGVRAGWLAFGEEPRAAGDHS